MRLKPATRSAMIVNDEWTIRISDFKISELTIIFGY
ncbi:hypothetical protein IFHNHDMJ_00872 [Synechococcus sp. CBW1107]|nr:hypothetical protein IFHNHDMJ_00872 [Synechococcus sp. CBW1107]